MVDIVMTDDRFRPEMATKVRLCVPGFYADNTPRLDLVDANTGEPWATCTVRLDETPQEGYAFIKNYSENEGMSKMLFRAGVILPDSYGSECGVARAHKLTDAVLEMIAEARAKLPSPGG